MGYWTNIKITEITEESYNKIKEEILFFLKEETCHHFGMILPRDTYWDTTLEFHCDYILLIVNEDAIKENIINNLKEYLNEFNIEISSTSESSIDKFERLLTK